MSAKGEFPSGSKHPGLGGKTHLNKASSLPVDPLLTIDDLCVLLKVVPATIYQLTYKGKLPHYKIANRLRFRQSEILAWIDEQRVNKTYQFGEGD